MRSTWLALSAASVALSVPRPADACSPPPCWPAAFVPRDQGHVPANVPGLYWRPMTGPGASSKPENVLLEDRGVQGSVIALTPQALPDGNYLMVPAVPLVEGHTYRLSDRSMCTWTDETGPQVTFSVGPQAELPSSLGTLSAAATVVTEVSLASTSGSCFSLATVAQRAIELALSSSAVAWLDVLHFETRVDGKPWGYATSIGLVTTPGESPDGRARDRVFEICSVQDPGVGGGMTAGKHTVTMQATLPGSQHVAMSDEISVELSCDPNEPQADTAGGGCTSGRGTGVMGGAAMALLALVRGRRRRAAR